MLSIQRKAEAHDIRVTKPTKADQRRNPDLNLMQDWLDDIERTIQLRQLDDAEAAEFRALCGAP